MSDAITVGIEPFLSRLLQYEKELAQLRIGIVDVCAYMKIPEKLDPPVPWNVAVKIFYDRATGRDVEKVTP